MTIVSSCRSRLAPVAGGPAFARSVQSAETAAAPANPPPATRSRAHHRCPRNTPPAAPESKPQGVAMVVPVAHDRSAHIIPPQTRRTWRPPVDRSTAYRKMSGRHRQLRVRNPDVFLFLPATPLAHRHARILRTIPVDHTISCFMYPDLQRGLLDLGACHSEKSS
jgi:hypothetical protein